VRRTFSLEQGRREVALWGLYLEVPRRISGSPTYTLEMTSSLVGRVSARGESLGDMQRLGDLFCPSIFELQYWTGLSPPKHRVSGTEFALAPLSNTVVDRLEDYYSRGSDTHNWSVPMNGLLVFLNFDQPQAYVAIKPCATVCTRPLLD